MNTGYFVPTTFYGFNIAQNCVHFAEKVPEKYALISGIYVRQREKTISKGREMWPCQYGESIQNCKKKQNYPFQICHLNSMHLVRLL